ncbi:hypothetical protein ACFX13_027507 [Malus domestica]
MFPRFRAVCKSWRSSIPPFKNLLQLPLELSVAFGKDGEYTHSGGFTVIESAVYHLAPPTDDDPRKELTDIPSSNNIFCPRPTWRWRDTPELSCRHDERDKDFRDGAEEK